MLNPKFGWFSYAIKGADADLILDDNLIDIKTTKNTTFKRDYWNQLIGYYILADCHNILCDKFGNLYDFEKYPNISTISIYFSRHGVLQSVDVDNIYII